MRFNRRTVYLILVDTLSVLLALGATLLLFGRRTRPEGFADFWPMAGIFVLCNEVSFGVAGLYQRLWRYATLNDVSHIFWGVGLGQSLGLLIVTRLGAVVLPLRLWVTQSLVLFLCVVTSRGMIRLLYEGVPYSHRNGNGLGKKVLIVGAGSAGAIVAREIERSLKDQYQAVGFVDDDPTKQRCFIGHLQVLGRLQDIPVILNRSHVDEIIIAVPSAEQQVIRRVVECTSACPVKMKVIPGVNEMITGRVDFKRLRDVQVEDLLGREPVKVNLDEVAAYITGKRVLITGAGGSIGSELCRQVAHFRPAELIMLGRGENSIYEIGLEMTEKYPDFLLRKAIIDVRDRPAVERVFQRYRPQVVFHAAAHKHVPLMEEWPEEAFKNNVLGTRNVALAAHHNHCERFVLISTDKAVRPSSVMGATKRVAEMVIRAINEKSDTRYMAVRFGNVLGSRGSVVPLFKRQIASGGPVTITHPDMKRYFMTIPEAVQLVIQAGAMGQGGEVFVLDMGEPVRIVELAENLIRLSGLAPGKDIKIEYSGVRPGEKLFEQLLSVEEGASATRHERIFVAALPNGIRKDLLDWLDHTERCLTDIGPFDVVSTLKQLVSEYLSEEPEMAGLLEAASGTDIRPRV